MNEEVSARVQPLVPAWRLDRTFDYLVPEALRSTATVGSLVRIPLGGRKVRGVIRSLGPPPVGVELETVVSVVLKVPIAAPPLDRVLDAVAERYVVPRGRVFDRAVPPRVRVRSMTGSQGHAGRSQIPTGYEGIEALMEAVTRSSPGTWVWQVDPSDDRSELIAALLACVDRGASLVILPEVRYAQGMMSRLSSVANTIRIDSTIDPLARSSGMMALARAAPEERLVGLGGRASILAPINDLRLVVLDEEHHPSLKEDRSPRYDARWVAVRRARESGAVCVLLSPVPSLETIARTQPESLVRPSPAKRKAARPLVMLAQSPASGLSTELHAAMRDELRRGGRVGLLVPGAGFARVVWCSSCRRSVRCPRCEAGMSYASVSRTVTCPRCRFEGLAPQRCSHCGSAEFRYLGSGSQRVASEMAKIFPRSSAVRVDPSVFDPGQDDVADIYITTWIGTKPEVRPAVGLVGVLDADWLIHRPDFRATEKAYQALAAMAAWAGPSHSGGRLVIQTAEPNHHCIQAIVRGDHGFFSRRESEVRKDLGYPPFVELVKIRASGGDAAQALDEMRPLLDSSDHVLGPIEVRAPDGSVSLEVLVKTRNAQQIATKLRGILPQVPKGTRLRIDVDPR